MLNCFYSLVFNVSAAGLYLENKNSNLLTLLSQSVHKIAIVLLVRVQRLRNDLYKAVKGPSTCRIYVGVPRDVRN